VIVRPFNNFGPRQHLEKAVPRFITSCLLDEPLRLHGQGVAQRDWIYVEDTCDAIDRIMHAPRERVVGEVINIGTDVSLSVAEVAQQIVRHMGKPESLITYVRRPAGAGVPAYRRRLEGEAAPRLDADHDLRRGAGENDRLVPDASPRLGKAALDARDSDCDRVGATGASLEMQNLPQLAADFGRQLARMSRALANTMCRSPVTATRAASAAIRKLGNLGLGARHRVVARAREHADRQSAGAIVPRLRRCR